MHRNAATGDMPVPECWEKLRSSAYACVALSARALPVILPVRYHVRDDLIVMCLGSTPPYEPILEESVAAFAIDSVDEATSSGWTVHVQGLLHSERAPGCPGGPGVVVRLEPVRVDGWYLTLCPVGTGGLAVPAT